mgnify:CR=1 FL=1|jgi:hypothetical protein
MQQVNIEFLENFLSRLDEKNMFEMIVKNIEESLVIFEDNRIKLLNHQFLELFKNIIIDFSQL